MRRHTDKNKNEDTESVHENYTETLESLYQKHIESLDANKEDSATPDEKVIAENVPHADINADNISEPEADATEPKSNAIQTDDAPEIFGGNVSLETSDPKPAENPKLPQDKQPDYNSLVEDALAELNSKPVESPEPKEDQKPVEEPKPHSALSAKPDAEVSQAIPSDANVSDERAYSDEEAETNSVIADDASNDENISDDDEIETDEYVDEEGEYEEDEEDEYSDEADETVEAENEEENVNNSDFDLSAFGNRTVAPEIVQEENEETQEDLQKTIPAEKSVKQTNIAFEEDENATREKSEKAKKVNVKRRKDSKSSEPAKHENKAIPQEKQKEENTIGNKLVYGLAFLCLALLGLLIGGFIYFTKPNSSKPPIIADDEPAVMNLYNNDMPEGYFENLENENQNLNPSNMIDETQTANPAPAADETNTNQNGTNEEVSNDQTNTGDTSNAVNDANATKQETNNENTTDNAENTTVENNNDNASSENSGSETQNSDSQAQNTDTAQTQNQLPDYEIGEGPKGSAGRVYFGDGSSYAMDWNGYSNGSPAVARRTDSMMTVISGSGSHSSKVGDTLYITDEYGYTYQYQCVSVGNGMPADGTLESSSGGNLAIEENGGISYWNIIG